MNSIEVVTNKSKVERCTTLVRTAAAPWRSKFIALKTGMLIVTKQSGVGLKGFSGPHSFKVFHSQTFDSCTDDGPICMKNSPAIQNSMVNLSA